MTHVLTDHPYFGVFVLLAMTAVAFPVTLWLARFVKPQAGPAGYRTSQNGRL